MFIAKVELLLEMYFSVWFE